MLRLPAVASGETAHVVDSCWPRVVSFSEHVHPVAVRFRTQHSTTHESAPQDNLNCQLKLACLLHVCVLSLQIGMQAKSGFALSADHQDLVTGGFTDPLACVTKAGYGLEGRTANQCQVRCSSSRA